MKAQTIYQTPMAAFGHLRVVVARNVAAAERVEIRHHLADDEDVERPVWVAGCIQRKADDLVRHVRHAARVAATGVLVFRRRARDRVPVCYVIAATMSHRLLKGTTGPTGRCARVMGNFSRIVAFGSGL